MAPELLNDDESERSDYVLDIRADYDKVRVARAARTVTKKLLPYAEAKANRWISDWSAYTPPVPKVLGVHPVEVQLAEVVDYIDWTPFFQSWQLAGKFPAILEDEVVGKEATELYADAQAMLQQIIDEDWLGAKAVFGIFEANSQNDTIVLRHHETASLRSIGSIVAPTQPTTTHLEMLRQQLKKAPGKPNQSLADLIAPADSGKRDYLGAFAVTAGIGIEEHIARFAAEHDDYSSILLKALADRLAEAVTEWLHAKVRREYWGYEAAESLSNEELIAERYRGIRPAPGYPACPDHTEKQKLWDLLGVQAHTGITLTESYAMYPAASVSGWYFAHPEAKYFGLVGHVADDQVVDYAGRKGMDVDVMRKWLAPVLAG